MGVAARDGVELGPVPGICDWPELNLLVSLATSAVLMTLPDTVYWVRCDRLAPPSLPLAAPEAS